MTDETSEQLESEALQRRERGFLFDEERKGKIAELEAIPRGAMAIVYACKECERIEVVPWAPGAHFMQGAPAGWGAVHAYAGHLVGYVCSRECYQSLTGESATGPRPPAGEAEAELQAIAGLVEGAAFDGRKHGESVYQWLERTLDAMRG